MVDGSGKEQTQYKLCKKYGKVSKIQEPVTNMYLTEDEYNKFVDIEAHVLKKIKYRYNFEGTAFDINVFPASNTIIAEAEFRSEDHASECILPPFIGEEVSSNVEYESASIAKQS